MPYIEPVNGVLRLLIYVCHRCCYLQHSLSSSCLEQSGASGATLRLSVDIATLTYEVMTIFESATAGLRSSRLLLRSQSHLLGRGPGSKLWWKLSKTIYSQTGNRTPAAAVRAPNPNH